MAAKASVFMRSWVYLFNGVCKLMQSETSAVRAVSRGRGAELLGPKLQPHLLTLSTSGFSIPEDELHPSDGRTDDMPVSARLTN